MKQDLPPIEDSSKILQLNQIKYYKFINALLHPNQDFPNTPKRQDVTPQNGVLVVRLKVNQLGLVSKAELVSGSNFQWRQFEKAIYNLEFIQKIKYPNSSFDVLFVIRTNDNINIIEKEETEQQKKLDQLMAKHSKFRFRIQQYVAKVTPIPD